MGGMGVRGYGGEGIWDKCFPSPAIRPSNDGGTKQAITEAVILSPLVETVTPFPLGSCGERAERTVRVEPSERGSKQGGGIFLGEKKNS
jgi:hypothetical protein